MYAGVAGALVPPALSPTVAWTFAPWHPVVALSAAMVWGPILRRGRGENCRFPLSTNDAGLCRFQRRALFPGKGVGLAGLSDGTSNTMLVGEQSGWQYYASTGVGLPGKQGDFRSTAYSATFTGTNANGTPVVATPMAACAAGTPASLHDHHDPLAGECLCGARRSLRTLQPEVTR